MRTGCGDRRFFVLTLRLFSDKLFVFKTIFNGFYRPPLVKDGRGEEAPERSVSPKSSGKAIALKAVPFSFE